jgi:hypothetical protein
VGGGGEPDVECTRQQHCQLPGGGGGGRVAG